MSRTHHPFNGFACQPPKCTEPRFHSFVHHEDEYYRVLDCLAMHGIETPHELHHLLLDKSLHARAMKADMDLMGATEELLEHHGFLSSARASAGLEPETGLPMRPSGYRTVHPSIIGPHHHHHSPIGRRGNRGLIPRRNYDYGNRVEFYPRGNRRDGGPNRGLANRRGQQDAHRSDDEYESSPPRRRSGRRRNNSEDDEDDSTDQETTDEEEDEGSLPSYRSGHRHRGAESESDEESLPPRNRKRGRREHPMARDHGSDPALPSIDYEESPQRRGAAEPTLPMGGPPPQRNEGQGGRQGGGAPVEGRSRRTGQTNIHVVPGGLRVEDVEEEDDEEDSAMAGVGKTKGLIKEWAGGWRENGRKDGQPRDRGYNQKARTG